MFTAWVADGLVTLDLDRPEAMRHRHVRIGYRRTAMSGCAPALFLIAAVIDRSFRPDEPVEVEARGRAPLMRPETTAR